MNCHRPEAWEREYAIGLKALSTMGGSARSVRRRGDARRRVLGRDRLLCFRFGRGRRDASREKENKADEGGESQKLFFQSRIAANTRTGSARRLPRYLLADSITAGSRQRRNGLVAFSSPSRLGSVGLPSARSLRSRASRISSARLPGSTVLAKPMLASVYSWPQYTFVSSGSAASFASEAYICSAVPSKRRPQPQANSVSPQKNAPGP